MGATRSFRLISALIAEPLDHIHAVHAFVNLSSSHPLQIPSKLFSSAFYSTPKIPTSSAASFESTPIAKFLLNECGFSLEDANDICRRKPELLAHKSYDNSRQTLLFLRDKGFHEIRIHKIFSNQPKILRQSFQNGVKPRVEFLEKIGLTGQKLSKALSRWPRLLQSSVSRTLEPRVYFLQSVLDPNLAVVVSNPEPNKVPGSKSVTNHNLTVSVICENLRILSTTKANSSEVVKDVEGLGIEKGSKAFARAFLQFSMLNRGTVKRKFENLRNLGFTEEEVRILVKRSPELLGSSDDKLRQNLKFLVEEWKLPRNVILSKPVALCLSIEKRLKPRLNALRVFMAMNKPSEKAMSYPPGHYTTMSEKGFHRKVFSRIVS